LSVGLTYVPIPVGGAITLLFVAERLLIGRPPQAGEPAPH
jgi:TRAP-type C4-dicarboxylate transport system permease small subunit